MKRSLAARCTAGPPATDPVNDTKATAPIGNQPRDILMARVQILEHTVGQARVCEGLGITLGHDAASAATL